MRQKGVGNYGKKGVISGPNIFPQLSGCPHATTSISLNLNLALYFIHGEKKSYMGVQAFPIFPKNPL